MALTGSITKYFTNYDALKFTWTIQNQSVANNTSTVYWELHLISESYGLISSTAQKICSITVNGVTYRKDNYINIGNNATKLLANGSTVIKHNADGTKTFSFSFEQQIAITFGSKQIQSCSASGTGELNRIPRASTISSANGIVGKNLAISINSNSSSFTHTLSYNFSSDNVSGGIVSGTSAAKVNWVIPTSFYTSVFANKASATCRLTCLTYDGDTVIGVNILDIKISVDEATNKPTLEPIVYDINPKSLNLTGNKDIFVRYMSTAEYAFNAQALNGASIRSYKVTNGGASDTRANGAMPVDSDTFVFTVTDTRGFTATKTITKTLVPYVNVTCNMDVSKPTTDGKVTITVSGNAYGGTFPAGHQNRVHLRWQKATAGEDINESPFYILKNDLIPNEDNTYSFTAEITGFDYQQAYTFRAAAYDPFKTVYSEAKTVKATPIFDWGENDFNFNVPVSIEGAPIADYVIETGTTAMGSNGTWYWEKWKSGKAICYGSRNFGICAINTPWGNYLYESAVYSQNLPSGLFVDVPCIQMTAGKTGNGVFLETIANATKDNTGEFCFVRPTALTIPTSFVNFYCAGRWK